MNGLNKKIISALLFTLWRSYLSKIPAVQAQSGTGVHINVNLPLPPGVSTQTGPIGFVQQFYYFGLMIGGLLAFGAIVYGGIKYVFAAGNPSGQSEGKEWIKNAIYGLLLL